MAKNIYKKRFNYDVEIRRFDAPKNEAGKWLDQQALEIAHRKSKGHWYVYKSYLEKTKDGDQIYHVEMHSEI